MAQTVKYSNSATITYPDKHTEKIDIYGKFIVGKDYINLYNLKDNLKLISSYKVAEYDILEDTQTPYCRAVDSEKNNVIIILFYTYNKITIKYQNWSIEYNLTE